MNRTLAQIPTLLLLLAVAVPVVGGPSDDDPSAVFDALGSGGSENAVRARLVAESTAVRPGSAVWIGVHLDQDEGWHTYWKNAGDAGLPTEVEWELPAGFSVSDLVWPAPHRYVEAGDLVTYGYEGHTLLLAELTVPADASGTVRIGAAVDWLMCKQLCIPGQASVELSLEIGAEARPAPASDLALFEEARARLPRAAVEGLELAQAVEIAPVPAGQRTHVVVAVSGLEDPVATAWTWFPEYRERLFVEEAVAQVDDGRLLVAIPLTVAAEAQPGRIDWAGVLELERPGAEPVFLQIDQPLEVAAAGAPVQADPTGLVEAALGASISGSAAAPAPGGNLFYYLLLALVGGVILNVMPCVLPVLSLKVMSFVQHAGQDRAVQFRLGLMFTAGVLASFLALALVVVGLQAAGELVGWGFQFQNPVFVVVMAAVVFAFGLSLFGVYEIILPVQLGGGGGQKGAYAESFLNGVLATALATPCTAPLLGSALGFAFSQPAAIVLAIFLTTGLGLALPYLLLSLNPGWLRFVPRPGAWMDRFKQFMGFLLMATLVWLLWVLGQQVGLDALASVMAFLLVLGFALWLYGSMLTLSSSSRRRTVVWVLVLGLVAGGWVQFVGGRVDAEAVRAHVARAGHGDAIPFSPETLEAEVAAGRTVFIDFTAAWCMTCKVNERTVIQSAEVQQTMADLGVVMLVGDWTNRDETITRVLRQYGRSGVPFYAVFPANRIGEPIVLPEVITRSLLIEALEQAGPSTAVASR